MPKLYCQLNEKAQEALKESKGQCVCGRSTQKEHWWFRANIEFSLCPSWNGLYDKIIGELPVEFTNTVIPKMCAFCMHFILKIYTEELLKIPKCKCKVRAGQLIRIDLMMRLEELEEIGWDYGSLFYRNCFDPICLSGCIYKIAQILNNINKQVENILKCGTKRSYSTRISPFLFLSV